LKNIGVAELAFAAGILVTSNKETESKFRAIAMSLSSAGPEGMLANRAAASQLLVGRFFLLGGSAEAEP
jgi:hypothetical protein